MSQPTFALDIQFNDLAQITLSIYFAGFVYELESGSKEGRNLSMSYNIPLFWREVRYAHDDGLNDSVTGSCS